MSAAPVEAYAGMEAALSKLASAPIVAAVVVVGSDGLTLWRGGRYALSREEAVKLSALVGEFGRAHRSGVAHDAFCADELQWRDGNREVLQRTAGSGYIGAILTRRWFTPRSLHSTLQHAAEAVRGYLENDR